VIGWRRSIDRTAMELIAGLGNMAYAIGAGLTPLSVAQDWNAT